MEFDERVASDTTAGGGVARAAKGNNPGMFWCSVRWRSDYPIEDSIWAKFKRTFSLDLLQT